MTARADSAADILIIGAGTAGCILANRLSADGDRHVVLLEAGGADTDPRIHDPRQWPFLQGSAIDWNYRTEPQAALAGRSLPYPRGKVLGGSSAINALGHQRGHRAIFDRWAAAGNPGWSYEDLLPSFRRSEDFSGGADFYHGVGGPIGVVRPEGDLRHPVAAAFLEAVTASGHAFIDDFNGAEMAGGAWNQLAMRDDARESSAVAYLNPARDRPNLTILTGAKVVKLDFNHGRCAGATVVVNGQRRQIDAQQTLLCAGAIDSPRLLMLSGIGPAPTLGRLGIEPGIDLPGVGQNLHDHPLAAGIVYSARRPVPVSRFNHGEGMFFAASSAGLAETDLLIMCVTVPFATADAGDPEDGAFTLVPCLMAPRSRGTVTLRSSDPLLPALIDPNYLAESVDFDRFVLGIEMARELGGSSALADWREREVLPGPGATSLKDFARRAASPFYHPVGTCRMGNDAEAVVDAALSVRGIDSLKIIDASIIPEIPNAMPNAAVIAIAELAAERILADR